MNTSTSAQPAPLQSGVLGLGIGGNRLLSGATTNPSALARFGSVALNERVAYNKWMRETPSICSC
jgi:hypothetical protein